jgi:hypothetical protein
MRLLLAYTAALVLTGFASAGSCYTPLRVHAPYVAPVVHHVKKVVVAEVIAIPVLQYGVVAYGGAYVPPVVNAAPVAQQPPAEDLRKRQTFEEQVIAGLTQLNKNTVAISDDVQALKARVAEVERRTGGTLPAPQPVPTKQPDKTPPLVPNKPLPGATGNLATTPPAVAVLGKHCAACHTEGKLVDNSFAMFDGDKLLELNDRQWRKVSTKMATQKMPPEKDAAGKALPQPTPEEYAEVVKFIDTLK